jgi:hypothetical protein
MTNGNRIGQVASGQGKDHRSLLLEVRARPAFLRLSMHNSEFHGQVR